MPSGVLPPLAESDGFVATASELIAALHRYFDCRGAGARLEPWVARLAQLAREARDLYDHEEAARLVELACRWATEQLTIDHEGGTITLPGPPADSPPHGYLTSAHIDGAIALGRNASRHEHLLGELDFDPAWLATYPFALHLVATRTYERVLGYMATLPMGVDGLSRVLRNRHDTHIPVDWIAACAPGERVHLYMASVVVRLDADRLAVKDRLRASFALAARWLRARGVAIEAIVAIGTLESGCDLLHDHGFRIATDLEAKLCDRTDALPDGRRLYEMVSAVRPPSKLGQLLYDAAFGP
jgi:hypothetical protein